MNANLRLSRKSMYLIIALMIPISIAFALEIKGTDGNDIIFGTAERDKIDAKEGNDIILGLGNDEGTQSKEELKGQRGNDEIIGDADVFNPTDPPVGTPGPDKIDPYRGDDFAVGDQGDDEIKGGKGNGEDILFGGPDNDLIKAGDGDDELHGGFGDDVLKGEKGDDFLFGDHGDDILIGGDGSDFLDGSFGNDDLSGGSSPDGDPDFLDGGPGIDICRVGPEDTFENCETVVDEETGLPIEAGVCGDGTLNVGEQCDDGNNDDNDGCSATCEIEECGDGIEQTSEECDDGNTKNNDGCSATCQDEVCGDGIKQTSEECDDGNNTSGDGCSAICELETGSCGDGNLNVGEQCDDGNMADGDGCSSTCELEIVDGFMLSNNDAFDPFLTEPFQISLGGDSLFLKITSDVDIHYSTFAHPDDHIKKVEFEIKVGKVKVKGTAFAQNDPGVFTIEVESSVLNSVFSVDDIGLLKLKLEDDHKNKLEFKNIPVTFVP